MLIKRHNPLEYCELKTDEDSGTFRGYASVFNNDDSDGDTILPGAFKGTIKKRRPLMLYSHDPRQVIGIWKDLTEDSKGLKVEGEFTPGHSTAENVYASLKHGAMDGLSIGFRIPPNGAKPKDKENPFAGRIIKKVELFEVSVVAMPANSAATVFSVKEEILEQVNSIRDAEYYLRDSGFSRSAALAFVARFQEVVQSDSVDALRAEIKTLQERLEAQGNTAQMVSVLKNL